MLALTKSALEWIRVTFRRLIPYETKTIVDGVDVSDTYFSGGTGAYGIGDVGHVYQAFRRSELDETAISDVPSSALQELNVYAGTFTAEYPTHSDVFFMGVECGILMAMLLVCLFLFCLLLYIVISSLSKSNNGQKP